MAPVITKQTAGGKRLKWLIWPAAVAIPLIAAFSFIVCNTTSEALSTDEILAKKEWTDAELQAALARSMSPVMTQKDKKEVMSHLAQQLQKRSPQDQERIKVGAVAASVTASLDQVRKMPVRERDKMLDNMEQRAQKSYDLIHSNPAKRREVEAKLKTREMEAFTREVNRVIFAELTPAERIKFAPVTKIWIKTMKTMGH